MGTDVGGGSFSRRHTNVVGRGVTFNDHGLALGVSKKKEVCFCASGLFSKKRETVFGIFAETESQRVRHSSKNGRLWLILVFGPGGGVFGHYFRIVALLCKVLRGKSPLRESPLFAAAGKAPLLLFSPLGGGRAVIRVNWVWLIR